MTILRQKNDLNMSRSLSEAQLIKLERTSSRFVIEVKQY